MNWIALSLLSAFFLGLYDVAKKASVKDNAVAPVLFISVLIGAAVWGALLTIDRYAGGTLPSSLSVDRITRQQHFLLAAKSLLVGMSWTCAFFALKHLPISIASPIRATSPAFTVCIAVLFMHERPNACQWFGIATILTAFWAFSRIGKSEGISFYRDRWVGLMILATLLGASSAIYDKYLLQSTPLTAATVQAWFSIYLVPVMAPLAMRWLFLERKHKPFRWRWSIVAITLLLLIADFIYFSAIAQPGALISAISPVRRTSIIISFVVGILWLKELNWRPKLLCIAAILGGVFLLSFGR